VTNNIVHTHRIEQAKVKENGGATLRGFHGGE